MDRFVFDYSSQLMKSDRQNIPKYVQWQEAGWYLINSEIHKGKNVRNEKKNVRNDLMQVSTYGNLKGKLSKHTFHFQCKQIIHCMFQVVRKPILLY